MRRLMALLAMALAIYAILPDAAQAQVIIVGRPAYYAPPTVVTQSYYPPPVVTYSAPPVVTYSAPRVVTYSAPYVAPQSVVTYSAPPSVVTYSAPVYATTPGVYTTRSYYGFGILRPRGWTTTTYYQP